MTGGSTIASGGSPTFGGGGTSGVGVQQLSRGVQQRDAMFELVGAVGGAQQEVWGGRVGVEGAREMREVGRVGR